MAQFRDIPVAPDALRVRVELPPDQIAALARIGHGAGLSVAAVCRLALGLLARGEAATADAVQAEAERVRGARPVPGPAPAPRPRGRPKKSPPADPA